MWRHLVGCLLPHTTFHSPLATVPDISLLHQHQQNIYLGDEKLSCGAWPWTMQEVAIYRPDDNLNPLLTNNHAVSSPFYQTASLDKLMIVVWEITYSWLDTDIALTNPSQTLYFHIKPIPGDPFV